MNTNPFMHTEIPISINTDPLPAEWGSFSFPKPQRRTSNSALVGLGNADITRLGLLSRLARILDPCYN